MRLGVIGGSNSAGQGVWADNQMVYSQLNMHVRLFNFLNKRFPQSGGGVMQRTGAENENSFVNAAQFGKGTEYFAMCSQVHLPEDLDLVIVEFGECRERGGGHDVDGGREGRREIRGHLNVARGELKTLRLSLPRREALPRPASRPALMRMSLRMDAGACVEFMPHAMASQTCHPS